MTVKDFSTSSGRTRSSVRSTKIGEVYEFAFRCFSQASFGAGRSAGKVVFLFMKRFIILDAIRSVCLEEQSLKCPPLVSGGLAHT